MVTLAEREPISPESAKYLNRLSDALFVWSRWINAAYETPEHLWNAKTAPPA
jgi:cob(I)alamin adenosyltransferase